MITVRFLYYNWFGIIPDDYTEGNKNMIQAIVLLVFLIFLNSVFAGAEMAILSMNEAKMRELAEEGDHRAQILIKLTEQPAHFMTAIRVTVTTAGFLQSAFAAEYFAQPMTEALIRSGIDVPQNVLKIVCMIIVTILLSYVSLLFGELVPRRLGMKNPDELSLRLAGLLKIAMIAVWPATALLTVTANGVLYLMGIKPEEKEEQATEEEIRMLLTEGNEQGSIQQEESEMIQNVFDLDDTAADEICTHRRDVVVLYMEDSDEEWERIIRENRHTFYPVCGEDQDDIIHILDTRDYFRLDDRSREAVLQHACYSPFFVPESMRANLIFREMREKRDYFAVVLDEYGCFVGIVTLHDLVETLVGDIDDRTDLPKPDEKEYLMQMDGREVFMFAVKSVPQAVKEVLEKNNVAQEEISFYILHQANKRIVEAIAKRLGEPLEKFPMNLEEYGNTSSASIPILLDELNRAGKLQKGQKIILAGFGAGLTWGASILEW